MVRSYPPKDGIGRLYVQEAHITLTDNGHEHSIDCWCEPVIIYIAKNNQGIEKLIVEHNDETLDNRLNVIINREKMQDWVTRITSLKEPK